MSKIKVTLKKEILTIEKKNSRKSDEYTENIPLDTMEYGKDYKSNITVTNKDEKNKVLFIIPIVLILIGIGIILSPNVLEIIETKNQTKENKKNGKKIIYFRVRNRRTSRQDV